MPADRSRILAVLGVLAGLGAVAAAIVSVVGEVRYAWEGIDTTAEVVAVERQPAGFRQHLTGTTPRYVYRLRYRYEVGGINHVGEQTGDWGAYRVGQPVTVQYLETEPRRSRPVASQSPWVWLLAAGLLLLGVWLVATNARFRRGGPTGPNGGATVDRLPSR